jgi:uncharacterized membrane protein
VGIHTPWTLVSGEVWKKTHQLAGRIFIFALMIYSYLVYQRVKEKDSGLGKN